MAYKDRGLFSPSSGGWKSDGRCRRRGSFWRLRGTLLRPPLLASFCWWLATLGIRWLVEASLQSLSPSSLARLLSVKVTLPSVVSDPNDLILRRATGMLRAMCQLIPLTRCLVSVFTMESRNQDLMLPQQILSLCWVPGTQWVLTGCCRSVLHAQPPC